MCVFLRTRRSGVRISGGAPFLLFELSTLRNIFLNNLEFLFGYIGLPGAREILPAFSSLVTV